MSLIDYNVYRKEVINFLQTVSIKFSLFAELSKITALNNGIIIENDTENPYYLNLCGLYSSIDKPIYINTVETNEQVVLSKEILEEYPKTASIYRIPNKEYETLILNNQQKQGLIKSIIYPAKDLDTVISARDLTLLSYDSSLLETNERESLILAITKFLDYVYNRWYVKDFSYEPAYAITFMGILYSILPSVLLTQRIQNLRTSQVHSMHVWEYLDSKGLGQYKSILNQKQSLFLYRNIDYIYKNKGKKTNIEILAENLLKDLHVTLVGKTILQETETYKNECISIPEFLSDSVVQRGNTEQLDEDQKESMSDMLYRMYSEGYYPDYSVVDSVKMTEKFGLTELNSIPTRLLEFQKNIIDNKYLYFLTEFLIDSLMYKWSKGKINFKINFIDTNTKNEISLSVGDAILLLHYAHFRSFGITPIKIPILYTSRICYHEVKPKNLPIFFEFNGFKWMLDSIIDTKRILSDIVFDPGKFSSQEEFLIRMANQFGTLLKHVRQVRESGGTLYQRAMLYFYNHLVVHKTFELHLTNYRDYQSWITSSPTIETLISAYNNLLNSNEFYHELCNTLYEKLFPIDTMSIFDEFTGADKDNTIIYAGLKKLFIQLCCYRLFFLETDRKSITSIIAPFTALLFHHSEESSDLYGELGLDNIVAELKEQLINTSNEFICLENHHQIEKASTKMDTRINNENFNDFADSHATHIRPGAHEDISNGITEQIITDVSVGITSVTLSPI